MRLPRMTTRKLMAAVAGAALIIGYLVQLQRNSYSVSTFNVSGAEFSVKHPGTVSSTSDRRSVGSANGPKSYVQEHSWTDRLGRVDRIRFDESVTGVHFRVDGRDYGPFKHGDVIEIDLRERNSPKISVKGRDRISVNSNPQ
jgi:hypothetical protein